MSSSQMLLMGEGAGGAAPAYIEDVFSTWLYTGNGSTQTITNNIDLSTKGGMVWTKGRSVAENNGVSDTARGPNATVSGGNGALITNGTSAGSTANHVTAFNTNGFTLGNSVFGNDTGTTYASWTFRKQPKFFQCLTYTGDGSAGFAVAHNLGSVPGCIIVKRTDAIAPWQVYHRSLPTGSNGVFNLVLNTTAAQIDNGQFSSAADATNFYLGPYTNVNAAGGSYVAYVFAHDAGGFGLTGTDNVISCGTYSGNGSTSGPTINLGYEPQWVMIKRATGGTGNWRIYDTMRGWITNGDGQVLYPNLSSAESTTLFGTPTATGFQLMASAADVNASSSTYIYIAIRRGPMKVPTSGTSVFSPVALNAPSNGTQVTTNFPVDLSMWKSRGGSYSGQFQDRLRGLPATAGGGTVTLYPDSTIAESSNQSGYQYWNTGFRTYSGENNIWWTMGRAPSFMDVVCFTGNGTGVTVNHNLTVAPELIILKSRSAAANWVVRPPGAGSFYLNLNNTNASTAGSGNFINNPTATTFSTGDDASVNTNGVTYVAYLFASCTGVSKVGTYTGTGSTLTIDCGFAGGARFVMIKRTSNSGNWFVWDTARGMVSGTDPRLVLNTTAAEANSNWVFTVTGGFQLVEFDNINITGSTYIYLAIA